MKVIVIDLDGTVANCEHRLHHIKGDKKDWDTFYKDCINDEPIKNVVNFVEHMCNMDEGNNVGVFITGRSRICEEETRKWIKKNFPGLIENSDYYIYMREERDYRPDHEIKPELLEKFFNDKDSSKENVWFILEDRASVVDKWRELGYTCFQVAKGDF